MHTEERIQRLNDKPARQGRYVLYWMQASQRAESNAALEFAAGLANERNLPLAVCFGLTDGYPEANERHYAFMLEGLAETAGAIQRRGVQFVLRRGEPAEVAAELAEEAAIVVADCGYLRHQRAWRAEVADRSRCSVVQVEADVVAPVAAVSDHEEFAARTLRPKLQRLVERFLVAEETVRLRRDSLGLRLGGVKRIDAEELLGGLKIDRSVGRVRRFRGGTSEGRRLLAEFIRERLASYGQERNDPSLGIESHMSPYLHFGQLSPVEIAMAVRAASGERISAERRKKVVNPAGREASKAWREEPLLARAIEAYLEELIVRRELAMNFCRHNPRYDAWEALPLWARTTLKAHAKDRRPAEYSPEELAGSRTGDPYWNAAMTEMRVTGKMHNYMRMYWGKKIIEWTRSPRKAFAAMLVLNNRYFIDGRDPVSYANVAWCFGKHDRPWTPRPVFGTVRYMAQSGLARKFDMEGYVARVEGLVRDEEKGGGEERESPRGKP